MLDLERAAACCPGRRRSCGDGSDVSGDITAAELVIEAFYPADPATAQALEEPRQ
jgi:hypothetical protein